MLRPTGFIIAILIPLLVLAGDGNWKLTKDKNDILTYIGPGNDNGLKPTRSIMLVDQKPVAALAAILDFDSYTDWVPYCKESKVIEILGDSVYHFFQLLDMPLIKNRDMYIKVRVEQVSKAEFLVNMRADPSFRDVDEDAVRIELLNADYHIHMDPSTGKTLVEMKNEVDPGGFIPTFALNWASRSQPFETFTALKAHMEHYVDVPK